MGPADLLVFETILLTGILMLLCWLFADKEKKE